jgi:hypothetical protein
LASGWWIRRLSAISGPERIDSATQLCTGRRDGCFFVEFQVRAICFGLLAGYPATIQKSFFPATILNESVRASGGGNSLAGWPPKFWQQPNKDQNLIDIQFFCLG